jgi:hypothetical protein
MTNLNGELTDEEIELIARHIPPRESLLLATQLIALVRDARSASAGKASGYCAEGDRCVCGGDLPRVREGCGNWRKPEKIAAPTPAAAQDAQAKDDRYTEGYDDGMANARELLADMRVKADDHRRLVRELDVLLNGEEGAAKQASLCDVVAQVRREGIRSVQHKGDEAQDERGAFEVWFIQESRRGKTILGAWDAWQARAAASPVSGAPGDVLAERIRTKLHSIRAKTGNALFDAGVHDACEKIESLLAEIERGERAGEK